MSQELPSRRRRKAERRGKRGEGWATWLLRLKGYRILVRRARTPLGEIDIIARRGRVTAFIEVKARDTPRCRHGGCDAVAGEAHPRCLPLVDCRPCHRRLPF
jgi:putative endonuclease